MSQDGNVIIFNVSKKEAGMPNQNMKKIIKKYKGPFKCGLNKEEISYERLKQAHLLVLSCPREMFSKAEFDAMKKFLENGGKIFILLGEGGEQKQNTNLNYFMEQYGISVNSDSVVRTAFYKYFHPKECYIHNGILNEEVVRVANGRPKEAKKPQTNFISTVIGKDDEEEYLKEAQRGGLDFVYVNGSSLNVQEPAKAILTSSALSYPSNRPIAACYTAKNGKGKLGVIGSYEMFSDEYLEKEDNAKLFDFFIKFFMTKEVEMDWKDEVNENAEYNYVPDIAAEADKLKSCLQESEDIPMDFKQLFHHDLYRFDTDLIPESVKLYAQLKVKHDTMSLITPQFETPMLGLQPASKFSLIQKSAFPPILRELPPPNLELFDLDDEFASEKVRLAQLTNKCNNEDLEYFVKESGDILGVSEKTKTKNDAKAILAYILEELVRFKKFNQG